MTRDKYKEEKNLIYLHEYENESFYRKKEDNVMIKNEKLGIFTGRNQMIL